MQFYLDKKTIFNCIAHGSHTQCALKIGEHILCRECERVLRQILVLWEMCVAKTVLRRETKKHGQKRQQHQRRRRWQRTFIIAVVYCFDCVVIFVSFTFVVWRFLCCVISAHSIYSILEIRMAGKQPFSYICGTRPNFQLCIPFMRQKNFILQHSRTHTHTHLSLYTWVCVLVVLYVEYDAILSPRPHWFDLCVSRIPRSILLKMVLHFILKRLYIVDAYIIAYTLFGTESLWIIRTGENTRKKIWE